MIFVITRLISGIEPNQKIFAEFFFNHLELLRESYGGMGPSRTAESRATTCRFTVITTIPQEWAWFQNLLTRVMTPYQSRRKPSRRLWRISLLTALCCSAQVAKPQQLKCSYRTNLCLVPAVSRIHFLGTRRFSS